MPGSFAHFAVVDRFLKRAGLTGWRKSIMASLSLPLVPAAAQRDGPHVSMQPGTHAERLTRAQCGCRLQPSAPRRAVGRRRDRECKSATYVRAGGAG